MLVNYGSCAIFFITNGSIVKGDWRYTKNSNNDAILEEYLGTASTVTVPNKI